MMRQVENPTICRSQYQLQINLVSPSLFSLHSEGEGIENLTSLSNLLQGLPMHDQWAWLDLVMEVCVDHVDVDDDQIEGSRRQRC